MSFGKKIGFFSAFIIPALLIIGYNVGGWGNFLPFIFVFVLLPIFDYYIGKDTSNISDDQVSFISKEKYYKFILYIWVYIQTGVLFWGFYVIVFGNLTTLEWIGFILGTSYITGGIGITVAHELGHKNSKLQQFYSKFLLMTVCYMHFFIEHNQGHHVYVATPMDPATARKGESFYLFWARSVFKGYAHAWKIENSRLAKNGIHKLSLHNRMILFSITPIIFCAIITLILSLWTSAFAWQVPVYFFSQSILAFTLLEHVNYIEHYGITRKEIEPGKFERVSPRHSWNANHLLSNFFLFQLQRHSDHHVNAIRPYQALKHYDESPQLPAGYPTMVLLTLVPPLWFTIIDKRLENYRNNQPLILDSPA